MTPDEISKRLSYVLRHRPDSIGITLDSAGWVAVEELLAALGRHGVALTREALAAVVADNKKQRFALSPDGDQIRANQGHSVTVALEHAEATPPDILYHGTVDRFLDAIRGAGLDKGQRHHVHLSATPETATEVGGRRGRPVLLIVRAAEMARDGHRFWLTPNGVWLTEHVPASYIDFPDKAAPARPR